MKYPIQNRTNFRGLLAKKRAGYAKNLQNQAKKPHNLGTLDNANITERDGKGRFEQNTPFGYG